jgi:hypothetical protein
VLSHILGRPSRGHAGYAQRSGPVVCPVHAPLSLALAAQWLGIISCSHESVICKRASVWVRVDGSMCSETWRWQHSTRLPKIDFRLILCSGFDGTVDPSTPETLRASLICDVNNALCRTRNCSSVPLDAKMLFSLQGPHGFLVDWAVPRQISPVPRITLGFAVIALFMESFLWYLTIRNQVLGYIHTSDSQGLKHEAKTKATHGQHTPLSLTSSLPRTEHMHMRRSINTKIQPSASPLPTAMTAQRYALRYGAIGFS